MRGLQRPVIIALLFLFGLLLIKSAWLTDDAYIPLRTIDNWLHGWGLRWNVSDRVQVFTEPLWLFVVAAGYWVTHEIFMTLIVMCIVVSVTAVSLVAFQKGVSQVAVSAVLIALISSKAFVDFSTSGLENPLSFLLVVVYAVVLFRPVLTRRNFRWLVLWFALLGVNRLDLMLMLMPSLGFSAWTLYRRDRVKPIGLFFDGLIFSAPLWLWLLFATIYYGYPFPNTYYAKLYIGVPRGEQLMQGLLYYFNSIDRDPVTLATILIAVVAALTSRDLRLTAGGIGIVLYLLYIIHIGGDFMSGRFFSVPFLFGAVLLTRIRLRPITWAALAILWLGLGLTARGPTLFYNERYAVDAVVNLNGVDMNSLVDRRGIADERGVYFQAVGLLPVLTHSRFQPFYRWVRWGREQRARQPELVVFGTPGMFGFYAGPLAHIVDYYGLCDPLLSKLPIYSSRTWRVGHYGRSVPSGYIETLQSGENRIAHPKVRELYRVTKILSQDPIWSYERFREILKMNTHSYDRLIRKIKGSSFGPPPPGDTPIHYPRQ